MRQQLLAQSKEDRDGSKHSGLPYFDLLLGKSCQTLMSGLIVQYCNESEFTRLLRSKGSSPKEKQGWSTVPTFLLKSRGRDYLVLQLVEWSCH